MKISLFFKNEETKENIYSLLKPLIKNAQPLIEKKDNIYILYNKLADNHLFYGLKNLCKIYNLKTEDSIYRDDKNFILTNEFKNIYRIVIGAEELPEDYILYMSYNDFSRLYGIFPEDEPKNHSLDEKELRCPFCGSYFFRSVYRVDVKYYKDEETGEYSEGWGPESSWEKYCCSNCYSEIDGL